MNRESSRNSPSALVRHFLCLNFHPIKEYLDQSQVQKRQVGKSRPNWDANLKSAKPTDVKEPEPQPIVEEKIEEKPKPKVEVKSVLVQTLGSFHRLDSHDFDRSLD